MAYSSVHGFYPLDTLAGGAGKSRSSCQSRFSLRPTTLFLYRSIHTIGLGMTKGLCYNHLMEEGHAFYKKVAVALGALAILVAGYFGLRTSTNFFNVGTAVPESLLHFLVAETVSASAPILVRIPEGLPPVDYKVAGNYLNITPTIRGTWSAGEKESDLVFRPASKLEIGKRYTLALTVASSTLSSDFVAAEDPQVLAIFPRKDSEAAENSAITIAFNRPMVPISTLDEVAANKLPIEVTPATEGKFKWISTRALQFIPKEKLISSSYYHVTIRPGFTSVEGLPVAGFDSSFTTRPLRYSHTSSGTIRYNEPIRVSFNQPVDIARTVGEMVLTNAYGDNVPVTAEYAQSSKKEKDTSTILVYPAHDSQGRERFWDLTSRYTLIIKKAYPAEGDIIVADARQVSINTTDIIEAFTASSARTDQASVNLFDPTGTTTVRFFEDVNISASSITAKGLKDIKYGQKCEEEGVSRYYVDECTLVPDKRTIYLKFDPKVFGLGEEVIVNFQKIVNADGLVINPSPITRSLKTYPAFRITKVTPATGSRTASLTDFAICATTPVKSYDAEHWKGALNIKGYAVFNYWSSAQFIQDYRKDAPCQPGEYYTQVRYGLLPETDYSASLKVEDAFGQSASQALTFRTTKADKFYTRLDSLQPYYSVTSPEHTKLTFAAENLEYANVNICQVSAETMLGFMFNRPKQGTPGGSLGCLTSRDVTVPLPKRYWVNNYFQIDVAKYITNPLGLYVVSVGNPNYVSTDYNGNKGTPIYERALLSITRLAVGEKRVNWEPNDYYGKERDGATIVANSLADGGQNLYWVMRFGSMAPVPGASVTPYTSVNQVLIPGARVNADASGVARSEAKRAYAGAIIRDGLDATILSTWTDNLGYASSAYSQSKTYIYTDRPIYRPGQVVHVKGIDRVGYDGQNLIKRDKPVLVTVRDSRGAEIFKRELTVSEYGTFNFDFDLPADAALGGYSIGGLGYGSFDVEEYAPAAFELTATADKDEYISGDTAKVNLEAKYYFGVPLEGGSVEYSVTSQDYHFDRYQDEYFNFGAGWYYCRYCGYGDRYLKRGVATLDKDGKASISEKLDLRELFKKDENVGSKILVMNITARDSTGHEISTQKSFIVHRGEFYLGVKTNPYFVGKNQDFDVRVKSVDTTGKPTSVRGATLTVNKVVWKTFKRREVDGNFYYTSEQSRTPVKSLTVSTDSDGNFSTKLSLPDEGEYEVVVTGEDGKGNAVRTSTHMYVWGEGSVDVNQTNNATLDLDTEKSNVNVGDTATVIIKSPYPRAKALVTVERGKVYKYEVVDIVGNIYAYQVPIIDQYVPNVYVSVLLMSSGPEMKFGQLQFQVNAKEHALSVAVTTNKQSYLPGETVEMDINTRDSRGNPESAEVSVAVADLSVLALSGNPKKDPLVFFYNGLPLTVVTATNIKNILHEADIPTGTKGGSGGGSQDELAKRKRGDFRDTAFWNATVRTDANGKAHVTFKLPDNLTTWQVETLGVTKDTKLGVNYTEIMARKDLSLVPIKPRFVVPGDTFMLGAKIFNQTSNTQNLKISIKSLTLSLKSKTQNVSIKAGETATVYFDAGAPVAIKDGVHTFNLTADGGDFVDSVDQTMTITKNQTPEVFATAGQTSGVSASEYVYIPSGVETGDGEVTISAQATLARYASDALDYMIQYPYGCSEQVGSQLSTIALIKRGLSLPNVDNKVLNKKFKVRGVEYTVDQAVAMGIEKIYQNQGSDGGVAYYKGLPSDFYLTLHTLGRLADLREAGYKIDQKVIDKAVGYLQDNVNGQYTPKEGDARRDYIISLAYTLSRVGVNTFRSEALKAMGDSGYIKERISTTALAELALVAKDEGSFTKNKLLGLLENRSDVDGRGAYIKMGSRVLWQYYETPIQDTALFIKVVSAYKNDNSLTPNMLRWLQRSREQDGSWGTTNNTRVVIDAMTDYLMWKRETESNYLLHVLYDGVEKGKFDVNAKTVFSDFALKIPVKDIEPNVLHTITFSKDDRNKLTNNFYYDVVLRYFLPAADIAARDEGFTVSRGYYTHDDAKFEKPLDEAKVGDVLRGHLSITVPKERNLVSVENFIPAGFELVNSNLATERKPVPEETIDEPYDYYEQYGNDDDTLYPDFQELHDDRLFLFAQHLSPGVYTYDYYIRALVPGTYQELPAVVKEMYTPENFGRTKGSVFTINK